MKKIIFTKMSGTGNDFIFIDETKNPGLMLETDSIPKLCNRKNGIGAELDLKGCIDNELRDEEVLFSESVGRFIIETNPHNYDKIMSLANKYNVPVKKIGVLINKPEINIKGLKSSEVKLNLEILKEKYESTIPNLMEI